MVNRQSYCVPVTQPTFWFTDDLTGGAAYERQRKIHVIQTIFFCITTSKAIGKKKREKKMKPLFPKVKGEHPYLTNHLESPKKLLKLHLRL